MLLPTRPWLQPCPIAWGLVQLGPDSKQTPCGSARLGRDLLPGWQCRRPAGHPTGGPLGLRAPSFSRSF